MALLRMVKNGITHVNLKFLRRSALIKLLCLCWVFLTVFSQLPLKAENSDKYPSKELTIICPWAPGGGSDKISRKLAELLEEELQYPVSVVNRTGGSGVVGFMAGASAEPDGHTLTLITAEIGTLYWMGITNLRYHSFTNIAVFNIDPAAIIVRENSKWKTLEELQNAIISRPQKLIASGTAKGGIWDLFRAGWLDKLGIKETYLRWYPSNGAAPALNSLIAGHVDVVICSLPEAAGLIAAGKVRPLAVMAAKRNPCYPKVPTLIEKGVNFTGYNFRGLAVPQGTPVATVEKLEKCLAKMVKSPQFTEFMESYGFNLSYLKGPKLNNFLKDRDRAFGRLIKQTGLLK